MRLNLIRFRISSQSSLTEWDYSTGLGFLFLSSPRRFCFSSVCLSVYLSVSTITQHSYIRMFVKLSEGVGRGTDISRRDLLLSV